MKLSNCCAFLVLTLAASPSFSGPAAQQSPSNKPTPTPLTPKQIFAKWKPSVFTIRTDKGLGTGFVLGSQLLTCHHVIAGALLANAELRGANPTPLPRVLGWDENLDVAVFPPPLLATAAPADFAEPEVGDPLYIIGSPLGLDHTLTEGILSGRRTLRGVDYLQLSISISPGSSGSPVIDRFGNAVGIVVGTIKEGQQLNFAVNMKSVKAMLLAPGIPLSMVSERAIGRPSTSETDFVLVGQELTGIDDFSILIEGLGDELKEIVTKDKLISWLTTEITSQLPKVAIVSGEYQTKRFIESKPASNLIDRIKRHDAFVRQLYLNINLMKSEKTGTSVYSASLEFSRGLLSTKGLVTAVVWNTATLGYFGKAVDGEEKMRKTVAELVREFVSAWTKANNTPDNKQD